MAGQNKWAGEERRARLLQILKESDNPITGSELAARHHVSRQIIVGDITLLKARNEPIIATTQGYLYLKHAGAPAIFEKTVVCRHLPSETEKELNIIVDQGVNVKDVRIEHSVYGHLIAPIMVSNRKEVKQFMKKFENGKASFLSELTDGVHLHTLSSASEEALLEAEKELQKAGFLVEQHPT